MVEAKRQKKRVSWQLTLFSTLCLCAIQFRRARRAGRLWSITRYPCNSASKEQNMEHLFHILGIVYYTVALVHLVSEHIQKRKNEE